MTGFYLPGDPYFPNLGNGGWIAEETEKDPEVQMEEDPKDQVEDVEEEDSDTEYEVINPPYVSHVLAHRRGYLGPTPRWAEDL